MQKNQKNNLVKSEQQWSSLGRLREEAEFKVIFMRMKCTEMNPHPVYSDARLTSGLVTVYCRPICHHKHHIMSLNIGSV